MTAEPRMEELLASIRKAIHDDIGEVPASTSSQASGSLYKGSMRELHVKVGEAAGTAAAEIQQLREKINRGRTSDNVARQPARQVPAPAVEPAPVPYVPYQERPAYQERPKRSWRDLEPPSLRPTLVEDHDIVEPAPRRQAAYVRHEPPVEPPMAEPQPWHHQSAPALPPAREAHGAYDDRIMSGEAAEAVQTAFNRLAANMLNRATGERSIEDLAREMLRGMLKQWLDDNLPSLVERLIREEIERVARHSR